MNSDQDNHDGRLPEAGRSLLRQRLLHRELPDQSGQDYYVYVPSGAGRNAPLLVAVHDIGRDARELAKALVAAAEQQGTVVIAPVFPAKRFPNYQRLGRSRHPADGGRHADTAVTEIVADVQRLLRVPARPFYLFGCGAGGRFAMRFAMLHPELVSAVVFAEPETFTFPEPAVRFPRGIAPSAKRRDLRFQPEEFLRVPMTLLLGSVGAGRRAVRAVGADRDDKADRWIVAMRNAAAAYGLEPRVRRIDCGQPLGPAEDFLADPVLGGQTLAALFEQPASELLSAPVPARAVTVPVRPNEPPVITHRDDIVFEDLPPAEPPRRWRVSVLVLVLLLAIATPVAVWTGYRSNYVVAQDAVVRSYIADIGSRVDAVVSSIEVDTGDRVVAGQVIARLEDSPFRARLAEARSRLDKARRELEVERLAIENERQRLRGSLRETSADLAAASAAAAAAQSRVDEAQRQVELQRSLAAQGLVPAERARLAETELRTARALAAEARAAASAAGAGEDLARVASDGITVREKRISVLESEIAALEAEVALAESNLAATVIRAPDSGAVVRRIVQPGGSIRGGQALLSLWVGEKLWVEAWLDEEDLGSVRVGSPAVITFKSYPDREFAGVVETIGVSTDVELPDEDVLQPRQERMRVAPLVAVRIRLEPATAAELFPGMSATVGIRKRAE